MSTVTLAESAKLTQDELIQGVIEDVITVNRMFRVVPFRGITGNALAYDRENALGDAQFLGVGGTITAKNPATFTQVSVGLTTLIADAEVNNLIQETRSDQTDQTATQVSSKAKSIGRLYMDSMINGDGTGDTFQGLLGLVATANLLSPAGGNGGALSFAQLDDLIGKITDKDGVVDYFGMNNRTINSYLALLRALGGATVNDVITLPGGEQVPGYRGVPILRNDFIPLTQVEGSLSTGTSIIAGTIDDGSGKYGIAGLTAERAAGLRVKTVGERHDRDEAITRLTWYCSLALYNNNGLAVYKGINN